MKTYQAFYKVEDKLIPCGHQHKTILAALKCEAKLLKLESKEK